MFDLLSLMIVCAVAFSFEVVFLVNIDHYQVYQSFSELAALVNLDSFVLSLEFKVFETSVERSRNSQP